MTSKGCVLDLRLDDEGGTTAHDYSRYGNDGALTGGKWVENGIEFNGSSDYIDCGNDESLGVTNEITISGWMNPNEATSETVIAKGAYREAYWIVHSNNKMYFYGSHDGSAWNYNNILIGETTVNNWYHYVVTLNQTDGVKTYLNNIPGSSLATTVTLRTSLTDDLFISRRGYTGSGFFGGSISDVRIYNYALTPIQIEQQYDSAKHKYL